MSSYCKEDDGQNLVHYEHLHGGKGAVEVQFIFREQRFAEPALLLVYHIPPGASEGLHVHEAGDAELGAVDEFYYILEGRGEMQIDGHRVAVRAGEHVFTASGVEHGIENTSDEPLRVYLVAVIRDATALHRPGARPSKGAPPA